MSIQVVCHAPTLRTIRMVEEALKKNGEGAVSVAALKRSLPRQVNHATLQEILEYLEESNKIYAGVKGITWIAPAPRLAALVARGTQH